MNREEFLNAIENLLETEHEEQYEKFVLLIKNYPFLNNYQLKSIDEFDEMHHKLLEMLLPNDINHEPVMDFSQFKRFDITMNYLRRIIEKMVIDNCMLTEKYRQLELTVIGLTTTVNDLRILVCENEFQRLLYGISQPLKEELCSQFRRHSIRVDPLDEDFLIALYDEKNLQGLSDHTMNSARFTFSKLAQEKKINDKKLIQILLLRLKRNVEEHDQIHSYMKACKNSKKKPTFLDLLAYTNLHALVDYKPNELETLQKLFDFYINQYR